MKKITYLLSLTALLITSQAFSQENVIPENGNVVLGTTPPRARLQVAGSARMDSTLVVNDSVTMSSSARVGADLKVDGDLYLPNIATISHLGTENILVSGANGLVQNFSFPSLTGVVYSGPCDLAGVNPTWNNGPGKIFVGCPAVRVGIGTTSPEYTLDVRGDAKTSGHLWANQSLSVGTDAGTFAKVNILNTNRPAAIFASTVGNTQQYQRLMRFEYDNTDTKIMEVFNTATNNLTFELKADGAMNISNGTSRIFHLGTEGSLELKSGSLQTFKVETNGMIRGRRMKLDLNTWADYVFEPEYKLMPLSEVEAFVKAEKHLPNVPSEQELKSDGADVMELNKILMEKVEELTLYLIQQNKDTEALKMQLETLKAKVVEMEKTTK
jgi:hypothetical protein